MPGNDGLSDNETHDLLHRAKELLSDEKGATVRAETALRSGERMLNLIMLGLIVAGEDGSDDPIAPRPSPHERHD